LFRPHPAPPHPKKNKVIDFSDRTGLVLKSWTMSAKGFDVLWACCAGPPVWVFRTDMFWNSSVSFRVGFKAPWKCPINKKHLVVHELDEHIQTGRINILQPLSKK